MTADLLSALIAGAALIVSLTTLYTQFYRKRARLVGLLVDKPFEDHPNWFQYALVNTGNVSILVREVTCDTEHATFLTKCEQTPSVVAPGEIKLFRVDFEPREHEPVGVHFSGIAANGRPFEGSHRILGSGHIVPRDGSVYWRQFTIIG